MKPPARHRSYLTLAEIAARFSMLCVAKYGTDPSIQPFQQEITADKRRRQHHGKDLP